MILLVKTNISNNLIIYIKHLFHIFQKANFEHINEVCKTYDGYSYQMLTYLIL